MDNGYILPMIALRGLVAFPGSTISFDVSRNKSKQSLEAAMENDKKIFLTAQKDILKDNPDFSDVYKVGSVATVRQLIKTPNGVRVMVDVKNRRRFLW